MMQTSSIAREFRNGLMGKLPPVKGKLIPNAPLGAMTWFGVGGPAEVLFRPEDKEDLVSFIKALSPAIPVTVLGVVSNTIIRDGGIPGVTIRLGRSFAHIEAEGDIVLAGAGALDLNVSLFSLQQGLAGLEFLSGIPGTIGGALRMNAGAYDNEMANALQSADVLFRDGTVQRMTSKDMGMSYRRNDLPKDVIFLACRLQGHKGDTAEINARMDAIKAKRAETQPIRSKTGGSTFANPPGKKAWELIDAAGCRGLKQGGAQMSEMHANFMINTGDATAADLERLGEEVRQRVYAQSQIMLEWEIKRIGIPLERDSDLLPP